MEDISQLRYVWKYHNKPTFNFTQMFLQNYETTKQYNELALKPKKVWVVLLSSVISWDPSNTL